MTDHKKTNGPNPSSSEDKDKPNEIDKTKFGVLTPLTAVQIVSLLIKTDTALGACACACGACGACY